jgi:hypothetical protein
MPLILRFPDELSRPGVKDFLAEKEPDTSSEDDGELIFTAVHVEGCRKLPRGEQLLDDRKASCCCCCVENGPGSHGTPEADQGARIGADRPTFLRAHGAIVRLYIPARKGLVVGESLAAHQAGRFTDLLLDRR